jgi:hypothetical protein
MFANSIKDQCTQSNDELKCIIDEYNSNQVNFFNGENNIYLFSTLHKEYDKAINCDNIEATVSYMRNIILFNTMGSELYEDISEGLEKLCVIKPDCFNKAMHILDNNTRQTIEERFLRYPTFYDVDDISNCYFKQITKDKNAS